MALDPLRSIAVTPAPSNAAKPASAGASSAAASLGSALGSNSGLGSTGHNSDTGPNSGVGSGAATHSSGDASNSHAQASSKDSESRKTSSGAKSNSNTRSKPGPARTQTGTSDPDAGAARAAAVNAANQAGGANPQSNTPPATFLEALAQSQADAAENAVATAPAAGIAATGNAGDVTASTRGNAKTSSDKDSDASSPSSLAFISQSLAAAMAGVQQPAPAQANGTTGSAVTASDTDDDATEAVSIGSSSSAAAQKLATTLANDTAAGLNAAADANSAANGSKPDTPANNAPAADGSSAALSAFQAQMSISSHFQQSPAPGSNPNRIDAPVGSPAFNGELGGKITWLANQGIQSASVQLSPEHLGPLSVHISVQAGSASISFSAAHADTRAALEQALPQLREMFAANGLTLSDANVSHQSPRGQTQKQSITAIGAVSGGAGDEATSSTVTSIAGARLGLVDTYV